MWHGSETIIYALLHEKSFLVIASDLVQQKSDMVWEIKISSLYMGLATKSDAIWKIRVSKLYMGPAKT